MLVCTFGDALLDVVVMPRARPRQRRRRARAHHGRSRRAGRQRRRLGRRARRPCALRRQAGSRPCGPSRRVRPRDRGVELAGPVGTGRGGVVVSLVRPDGDRTMASDRGLAAALRAEEIEPEWLDCDHLHVSGYALAAEPMRSATGRAVALARERGARVSLDVAASTLVESIGAGVFRTLLEALAPDVVFCNEDEDATVGGPIPHAVWIVKRGSSGASVDGTNHDASPAARVVDTTGAGDAFAAGWIVGGISLALDAAARSVARPGAMPGES